MAPASCSISGDNRPNRAAYLAGHARLWADWLVKINCARGAFIALATTTSYRFRSNSARLIFDFNRSTTGGQPASCRGTANKAVFVSNWAACFKLIGYTKRQSFNRRRPICLCSRWHFGQRSICLGRELDRRGSEPATTPWAHICTSAAVMDEQRLTRRFPPPNRLSRPAELVSLLVHNLGWAGATMIGPLQQDDNWLAHE